MTVARFLVTDRSNPSSVVSCVVAARENLRTTRDTVPRDGWHAVNDLYLYVDDGGRPRRRPARPRALPEPRHRRQPAPRRRAGDGDDPRRGVRDVAPRAGARARRHDDAGARRPRRRRAVAEPQRRRGDDHDEVQWMGVLRSVHGLQMYQRAVRGPIEGSSVVRFLLDHDRFPRAVRALLREIRLRPRRAARSRRRRSTPSTTSRPCCATRRRPAPTAPRSTRRWTTCRSRSPSSTSGSPTATCRSARDGTVTHPSTRASRASSTSERSPSPSTRRAGASTGRA